MESYLLMDVVCCNHCRKKHSSIMAGWNISGRALLCRCFKDGLKEAGPLHHFFIFYLKPHQSPLPTSPRSPHSKPNKPRTKSTSSEQRTGCFLFGAVKCFSVHAASETVMMSPVCSLGVKPPRAGMSQWLQTATIWRVFWVTESWSAVGHCGHFVQANTDVRVFD